jgi:hypothetical protein
VKALADAMLDSAFESAALDTTRANVTAFLEAFFRESNVAFFGEFIAAFCEDALRTNKTKKARAGAQRLLETLMNSKAEQTATDIVSHAVSSLMRVHDDGEVAEILAAAMRRFMDAVLTLAREQSISEDVDLLTVQEAAGYLGLRPMSFHSHIRSRAKTPGKVPVKMLKKGRGGGTYAIALEDLQTWEKDHWQKISRSSRRRRRRMREEAQ